jgi:hypothetical protein
MKPIVFSLLATLSLAAQDPIHPSATPDFTYEMNLTGLALQPFANNLDYAAEAVPFAYGNAQPAVSPSWVIPEIDTDYHFGFDVKFLGVFREAASSLMVNWEWYHSPNDTASFSVPLDSYMIGPFFEIGPDASLFKISKGKVNFRFDEVNIDYGTYVQVGSLLNLNLFAGIGFNRIVENRSTRFQNLANTIIRTLTVPSKFMGAGPQLGMDFTYKVVKGLRFVGNTRATLLVGSFKNHTTFKTYSPDLVTLGDQNPNVQSTTVYDKGGIVPSFEGRLGLAYLFSCKSSRMLKIEAGYQAQIYLNAIRSTDLGSQVALAAAGSVGSQTTGVYARTFQRTVSDFSLAGPYGTIEFAF